MNKDRLDTLKSIDKSLFVYDLEKGEIAFLNRRNRKPKSIQQEEYPFFYYSVNKKQYKFKIHEIVCFLAGYDLLDKEVNHKDGDKWNWKLSNLEVVTRKENIVHSFETGLNKGHVGEKHGQAILTEVNVREIRKRLDEGEKGKNLAKEFGVSPVTISAIKKRRIWGHLE